MPPSLARQTASQTAHRHAMTALFAVLMATPTVAQTLDRSLTDPDAIAAQCGGEANAGQPIFAENCAACHSLTEDGDQAKGPHLAGLYGRASGGLEGYDYTSDLPERAVIWEGESLRAFLAGDMGAEGHPVIDTDQRRRDLLTYVRLHTRPAPPAPEEVVVPAAVLSMEGDVAFGEYLASDCLSCHNAAASAQGLASIYGRGTETFLTLMYQYKARAIGSETMQLYAANLSEEEMAALAAYFEGTEG